MSEIEVFLLANEVVRTDGSRLFRTRVNGTDEQYVNPLATEDGMPGYAVQWIEIEGPFYDDPAGGAGYERLFDQLRLVPSEQARTGVPLEIGPARRSAGPAAARRAGRGGPGASPLREALYEVESAAPREDAERLLRSFLKKAYRRPVAEADVQRFLAAVRRSVPARAPASRGRCSRPTRPSWRRRASCSSTRSRAGSTTTRWPRGWPCSCGTRSPTTRCGRWPTAAS